MANFELEPTRWVPLGHQIIDGVPTCLPRTFYTPSVAPPRRHDSICTAILMPPPPPAEEAAWREQVHLFIVQQLQRAVDDVQPCLFGLGFYRLRSPAARFALVDHGPYEIAPDVFVRFVNHDDRDNHRAVQGYRRGWLMFLGVHLDYRNEYDIANAVATFGKYHYWHHDDEVLERTLVYASFPSPALVPRDVIFGRYGDQGPVRESWTAPCYVLSADFADILPPDEDQMPANGNPHPMPGQMQQDNNIFVLPQYPELGWNEQVPPLPQVQDDKFFQPEHEEGGCSSDCARANAARASGTEGCVLGLAQRFSEWGCSYPEEKVWQEDKEAWYSFGGYFGKRRKIQKKIDQEDEHPSKEVKKRRKQKENHRADSASTSNICEVPPTPIPVMQKVGLALGIDATELTKEKFMAAPDDKEPTDVSNV
ncbi:hypothetical protein ACQ4PT_048398 [Festuca glaucescens]